LAFEQGCDLAPAAVRKHNRDPGINAEVRGSSPRRPTPIRGLSVTRTEDAPTRRVGQRPPVRLMRWRTYSPPMPDPVHLDLRRVRMLAIGVYAPSRDGFDLSPTICRKWIQSHYAIDHRRGKLVPTIVGEAVDLPDGA
jgi:hypothetical protein